MATASPDPEIVDRIRDPSLHGGACTVAKFIIERLKSTGLAQDCVLAPSCLGLHPSNRGSYGCNEESVHNLGADILEVGWDWDQIVNPLCVEEDPADRYVERYNMQLSKNSEFLAPVKPLSLRAGTLTNGHTVMLLRAIIAGVKSSRTSLTVEGHMSMAHIASRDPEMARAAQQGWSWTVLSHHTRKLYGDPLFELLSDSKNIQLQRVESEVQVLLKIFNMACGFAARVRFDAI